MNINCYEFESSWAIFALKSGALSPMVSFSIRTKPNLLSPFLFLPSFLSPFFLIQPSLSFFLLSSVPYSDNALFSRKVQLSFFHFSFVSFSFLSLSFFIFSVPEGENEVFLWETSFLYFFISFSLPSCLLLIPEGENVAFRRESSTPFRAHSALLFCSVLFWRLFLD